MNNLFNEDKAADFVGKVAHAFLESAIEGEALEIARWREHALKNPDAKDKIELFSSVIPDLKQIEKLIQNNKFRDAFDAINQFIIDHKEAILMSTPGNEKASYLEDTNAYGYLSCAKKSLNAIIKQFIPPERKLEHKKQALTHVEKAIAIFVNKAKGKGLGVYGPKDEPNDYYKKGFKWNRRPEFDF